MKSNKGYLYFDKNRNSWYARITFTDAIGKRKDIKRKVESKSGGQKVLNQILEKYNASGIENINSESITFAELTSYYEEIYCIAPCYVQGRKVAGLRSYVGVKGYLKVFRTFFGMRKLKSIIYEDLHRYRLSRLSTATHQSKQRSIASVNREMAYLRRLLNVAERNSWISKNPFRSGDCLIHQCDEVRRDRVLTPHECQRLIDACTDRREHLRPLIIAALDTGCRLGELLKLRWNAVDFDSDLITIEAFNTKTMRERKVSITKRLKSELMEMISHFPQTKEDLVFGVSEVRKSFKTACKLAELSDLRFHDLRHVHATNLDNLGFSIAAIGKQLGHTSDSRVTLRYINRTEESIRRVADALDDFHNDVGPSQESAVEFIN